MTRCKKTGLIALCCFFLLALCACGNDASEKEPVPTEQSEAAVDCISTEPAEAIPAAAETSVHSEGIDFPGTGEILTAVDYQLEDFEGFPCHVLLVHTEQDEFFAYSYTTDTAYLPEPEAVRNYSGALATEEDRCTYLLWIMDNDVTPYVNSTELRRELTEEEYARLLTRTNTASAVSETAADT